MLLRDLRSADLGPFQAALFDQPPGKMPHRALERAARAGVFQGLFRPAALGQVRHFFPNGGLVARGQGEVCPHDAPGQLRKDAGAIAQLQLVFPQAVGRTRLVQAVHPVDDLGHLPVIGSGVHKHAAADGAGDAVGKFQTSQPAPGGKVRRLGQGKAAAEIQAGLPVPLQAGQAPGQLNEKAVHALVGHQQIGPLAQKKGHDACLCRRPQDGGQFFQALGQGHERRRAAHPKRGVVGHRLVCPDL